MAKTDKDKVKDKVAEATSGLVKLCSALPSYQEMSDISDMSLRLADILLTLGDEDLLDTLRAIKAREAGDSRGDRAISRIFLAGYHGKTLEARVLRLLEEEKGQVSHV